MAQRARQAVGGQHGADHAAVFDHAAQFGHCRRHILHGQDCHAFQSRFMAEKTIVEIIVISPAKIDGEVAHADLADVHEAGWIKHRRLEFADVERLLPILQRRNQKRRADPFPASLTMPAMVRQQRKVHHRLAPRFVIVGQIFVHIAFDFANVAVSIDHFPIWHFNLH